MIDLYGRNIDYLRISITDRCNLKCIYCMPEKEGDFLSLDKVLTNSEIYSLVEIFSELGIKKVRLTGGEPLTRKNITDLIRNIKSIKGIEEISVTTNGSFLHRRVSELVEAGLTSINISLDTLDAKKYATITRGGNLFNVLKSIKACLNAGLVVKLNTVVMDKINADEVMNFIKLTEMLDVDVRFIELMPIGTGKNYNGISNERIKNIILKIKEVDSKSEEKTSNGPATYLKIKGAKGRVGFISPLSKCFCKECNRIRVTADGSFKSCLYYDNGLNLRELLRAGISKDTLKKIIIDEVNKKPKSHNIIFGNKTDKRYMYEIGG